MLKLKAEVTSCFEAAALSTRCKLKIVEKMEYKGTDFLGNQKAHKSDEVERGYCG